MLHAGPGDCERLCCDVYTAPVTVAVSVVGRARTVGGHSGCGVRAGGDGGDDHRRAIHADDLAHHAGPGLYDYGHARGRTIAGERWHADVEFHRRQDLGLGHVLVRPDPRVSASRGLRGPPPVSVRQNTTKLPNHPLRAQ